MRHFPYSVIPFNSVPVTHLKSIPKQDWRKTIAEILTGMKRDPGVTQQILTPDSTTVTSLSVKVSMHILTSFHSLQDVFKNVKLFRCFYFQSSICFKLQFSSTLNFPKYFQHQQGRQQKILRTIVITTAIVSPFPPPLDK